MKLQNKIFISFLFFVIFLFLISFGNVFASATITFTGLDKNEHTIPDFYTNEYDYSKGYILAKIDGTYYLYLIPEGCYIYKSYENVYNYDVDGNSTVDAYCFILSGNTWVFDSVVPSYYNPFLNFDTYAIWNSFDIPARKGCEPVSGMGNFFHQPVTEVTIPALEAVEQIPGIMTTILKIALPIGLIVLGIGLVISVVKSVICRHL